MSYKNIRAEITTQCKANTPERVIDIIAEHVVIASEAKTRIEQEGTVVRTLKGDVIQHPAIKVHADATKIVANLMKEWASLSRF